MIPKKIAVKDGNINFTTVEGEQITFSLKFLRDECPCAGCKGETILYKHYAPPPKPPLVESSYKIASIKNVGTYAVQIDWKDGHNTGIYSWSYLDILIEKQREEEIRKN